MDGTTPSVLLDLLLISLLLFSFHILFILERNGEMRRRNRFDSSFIPSSLLFMKNWRRRKKRIPPLFFPNFSFLKMEGITDCFFLIFSRLFLSEKQLIFSLFSSLVLPSSGNEKGIERAAKTDIASFFASPHFLHSPLVFVLLFSIFSASGENGDRKREFISSRFHFSFLLGNRSRQLRILLPSLFFFFSRRKWKWDRRKAVFLLLFLLIFFFRNGGGNEKEEVLHFLFFLLKTGKKKSWIFQTNILLRILKHPHFFFFRFPSIFLLKREGSGEEDIDFLFTHLLGSKKE